MTESIPDFKPNPVYSNEQIDQLILTPEARATVITRKVPKMVKFPIFLLDEQGNKVPLLDDEGKARTDNEGIMQYVIKDFEIKQVGWESQVDYVPATEIFNIDDATSNISHEAVKLSTRMAWFYNYLSVKQMHTNKDYSYYLHKIRNNRMAIVASAKSYNGGTIQAIKTFINKMDSKQWTNQINPEEEKKGFNPLAMIFGGNKKKEAPKDQNKAAFAQ